MISRLPATSVSCCRRWVSRFSRSRSVIGNPASSPNLSPVYAGPMKPVYLNRRRQEQYGHRQLEQATKKLMETLAEMSAAQRKIDLARRYRQPRPDVDTVVPQARTVQTWASVIYFWRRRLSAVTLRSRQSVTASSADFTSPSIVPPLTVSMSSTTPWDGDTSP